MSVKGGCLCGAVRYAAAIDPVFSGHCYCTDCQKGTGCGHVTVVGVPEAALTVTGRTATYTKSGDSGQPIDRVFCPTCGTSVFSRPSAMSGMLMVRAGTLDDPSGVVPGMSIYASRAQAWDPPSKAIPAFPEMPPAA